MTSLLLEQRLQRIRQRVDYQGFILGFICAVVTVSILSAARITEAPIQQRMSEDRLATLHQVMPNNLFDNDPLHSIQKIEDVEFSEQPVEIYRATKNGDLTGVIYQAQTEGYGGTIVLMLAVTPAGEIIGVRVLSHKETPGLADKIEMDKSTWITGFNGKSLTNTTAQQWHVKKDGGEFDQFTGATITPRAIVKGLVVALEFYQRQQANINHPQSETNSNEQ